MRVVVEAAIERPSRTAHGCLDPCCDGGPGCAGCATRLVACLAYHWARANWRAVGESNRSARDAQWVASLGQVVREVLVTVPLVPRCVHGRRRAEPHQQNEGGPTTFADIARFGTKPSLICKCLKPPGPSDTRLTSPHQGPGARRCRSDRPADVPDDRQRRRPPDVRPPCPPPVTPPPPPGGTSASRAGSARGCSGERRGSPRPTSIHGVGPSSTCERWEKERPTARRCRRIARGAIACDVDGDELPEHGPCQCCVGAMSTKRVAPTRARTDAWPRRGPLTWPSAGGDDPTERAPVGPLGGRRPARRPRAGRRRGLARVARRRPAQQVPRVRGAIRRQLPVGHYGDGDLCCDRGLGKASRPSHGLVGASRDKSPPRPRAESLWISIGA